MRNDPSSFSDNTLIEEIKRLISNEFISLAEFLSILAEIDGRRIYARLGFSSMFTFLTGELHLSEDAAYKRIQATRASRRFPLILSRISEGKINLTTITILSPILTQENHADLLTQAVHRSKVDVERIKAACAPKPDIPDMVRRLPQPTCSGASDYATHDAADTSHDTTMCHDGNEPPASPSIPARRDLMSPISEHRVKFQFTGSENLRAKIDRAKELLRHKHPHGKLEDIIDEALDALLAKKDPEKKMKRRGSRGERRQQIQTSSNPRTRYIPQHVKDLVWQRDKGECQYIGSDGWRCGARGFLEFDHIRPYAKGGSSDDPSNLRILCRTHNALAMRDAFGAAHPQKYFATG